MWKPDNFTKQNPFMVLIGSIRPMYSHFPDSCPPQSAMDMLDFKRLLLDPKSFVMLNSKLRSHYISILCLGLHVGRHSALGRGKWFPRKGSKTQRMLVLHSHYQILLSL